MQNHLIVGAFVACASLNAFATDVTLTNVKLDSLAVIGTAMGSHRAGNIEIAITGGISLPQGMRCTDRYWVTTLKTTDPDGSMLSLLNEIRSTGITGSIAITDEPSLQAFPGRCSIRAVQR